MCPSTPRSRHVSQGACSLVFSYKECSIQDHSFIFCYFFLFFLYSQSYTHWIILATMAGEPQQVPPFFNNTIVDVLMMSLLQRQHHQHHHPMVITINDHSIIDDVLHNNAHHFNAIHNLSCHHHLHPHHWLHLRLLSAMHHHHHHPLPMIPPLCHHLFFHQVHLM